jgi:microcystin-dependent protein
MALIQLDGIQFGNGTELDSYYGIIPENTTMVFYQNAAPTGWTQDSSQNDKFLRVVTGTGGGTGGTNTVSSILTDAGASGPIASTLSGSVGDTTLTEAQIPAHTHNTGSNPNSYRSAASSSPFRTDNRQPRGYNVRATTRTTLNNRVTVNFRQPTNVRQPRNYRQPRRQRVPLRSRQPRNFRVRYDTRSRNPFNFRVPVPFRVPLRSRSPFNFRADQGRSRRPIPFSFRQGVRNNDREPRRRGGRRRRNDRFPRRANRRRTANSSYRQRRQVRQPRSSRQRRSFRQPRNFRQPQSGRQRRQFRQRQPRTFRVRYSFRQRNSFRVNIPFRVSVPQRNPASYRQPRSYRTPQRYPTTTSVRISTRTLSPGGTIRNSNTQAPATSSTGGGQSHTHLSSIDCENQVLTVMSYYMYTS